MTPLEKLKEYLQIDKHALDDCLIEQPDVYYQVSEQLVQANAERDTLKLQLEELMAKEDQAIREKVARTGEKTTEAGIQNKIRTTVSVQALQAKYMDKRREAEEWGALKEAFSQRSFMLRELVALFIAQRNQLLQEAGVGQSRAELKGVLAEQNREKARAARVARVRG